MREERHFWLAAGVTLITAIALFLPFYRNTTYIVPRFGTFVSWYRESALWPALTHNASLLTGSILGADVLLLGSSKTLFGLSASQLNERYRSYNAKFFNLGVEGGEGAFAANDVINRLNLTHKLLLINLDDNMLSAYKSEAMLQADGMDWFQAVTAIHSVRANAVAETMLDQLGLPQLAIKGSIELHDRLLPRGIRDPVTGDGIRATYEDDLEDQPDPDEEGHPIEPAEPAKMLPASVLKRPHIEEIFGNWIARNMQLIFFTIPYGGPEGTSYTPGLAELAARAYGGSFIAIDWRGLRSPDYVHLDRKSQKQVTTVIADGLAALDFPTKLSRDRGR